jgi:hypothetical protein
MNDVLMNKRRFFHSMESSTKQSNAYAPNAASSFSLSMQNALRKGIDGVVRLLPPPPPPAVRSALRSLRHAVDSHFAGLAIIPSEAERRDPWSLALRIAVLQSTVYVVMGASLLFWTAVIDGRMTTVGAIFVVEPPYVATPTGKRHHDLTTALVARACAYPFIAYVAGSISPSIAHVLDFVLTVFAIHVTLRWAVYSSVASWTSVMWWFLLLLDVVCVTLLGEVFCAKRDRAALFRGPMGEREENAAPSGDAMDRAARRAATSDSSAMGRPSTTPGDDERNSFVTVAPQGPAMV